MFARQRKDGTVGEPSIRRTLGLVEAGALLFPTIVTLLVAITFLFGGRLAAWQWWGGIGFILGLLMWRRSVACASRVFAGVLFLSLLAFIYLAANVLCCTDGPDTWFYHFPVIRLLLNGWNPVYASTPETLVATMGIEPWGMRLYHVLFVSKAVHYFSAAANTFTNVPLNLVLPLFPFLFIGTAGQVWRLLRGWNVWIKLVSLVLLYTCSPSTAWIVDGALFFGGVGLLATMARFLRGEEDDTTLPLILFSFWMMTAKLPGTLSCFVFWVCFSSVLLFRARWTMIPRLAQWGGAITLLFAIVCAAPYITAAIHYGHPLYPAYSRDEARYPVRDITLDFRVANDDAKAMGHVGSFANAYLSPSLVRAYYRWSLNQAEFAPNRYVWFQGHAKESEPLSPLSSRTRMVLLGAFLIVAMSGKRFRFITGSVLIGCFCIPTCYLGFTRYIAWVNVLYLLAVVTLLNVVRMALTRFWNNALVWACLCGGVMLWHIRTLPLRFTVEIDRAYALKTYFATTPPRDVYCQFHSVSLLKSVPQGKPLGVMYPEIFGDGAQVQLNDTRLLCASIPTLKDTVVHPLPLAEEEPYQQLFGMAMRVAPGVPLPETELSKIWALPNRKDRLIRYPLYMLKVYTVILPRSMALRF